MKNVWTWIKNAWSKFEAWVATWAPGLKTKLVAALGVVGSTSAILQEYISGIPTDKFITGTQLAIVTTVLFSLAFWFRNIGERVASRSAS